MKPTPLPESMKTANQNGYQGDSIDAVCVVWERQYRHHTVPIAGQNWIRKNNQNRYLEEE